jgi:hypothetical protein
MAVDAGYAIVVERLTKHFGSLTALDSEFRRARRNGLRTARAEWRGQAHRDQDPHHAAAAGWRAASVLGLDVVKDTAAVRYQIGLAGPDGGTVGPGSAV